MNKAIGSNRGFLLAIVAIVVIGVGIMVANQAGWFGNGDQVAKNPIEFEEPEKKEPEPIPKGWVKSGDVYRPKSDIKPVKDIKKQEKSDKPFLANPGVTPHLKPDTNVHTKSVAEALKDPEKLGHRLSALIAAPAFDREAYEKDPQPYLDTIEPGRIWQSAKAGAGVVSLRRPKGTKYFHELIQGDTVKLEAVAEAGMPVTFYSPRLGQFENQLTTITVAADAEGIARADFKASSGTRGEIDILASSPVHSGQVRYLVKVVLPKKVAANNTPN